MTITLLATNIVWDTDGDDALAASLPTELQVELDLTEGGDWHDINQDISKQLSNQTDWLVLDYQLVGYSLSPAE